MKKYSEFNISEYHILFNMKHEKIENAYYTFLKNEYNNDLYDLYKYLGIIDKSISTEELVKLIKLIDTHHYSIEELKNIKGEEDLKKDTDYIEILGYVRRTIEKTLKEDSYMRFCSENSSLFQQYVNDKSVLQLRVFNSYANLNVNYKNDRITSQEINFLIHLTNTYSIWSEIPFIKGMEIYESDVKGLPFEMEGNPYLCKFSKILPYSMFECVASCKFNINK